MLVWCVVWRGPAWRGEVQRGVAWRVACARGARIPDPNPPPPAPDPPKVFKPVFLQFEILGERVGAEGAEDFFLPFLRGYFFFFALCVYAQNTQNFVEN